MKTSRPHTITMAKAQPRLTDRRPRMLWPPVSQDQSLLVVTHCWHEQGKPQIAMFWQREPKQEDNI